ncbi:MAG: acetate--CoA ligase family protein [Burkholderiales bacterium]|nr:MAG: acetate--CoA ligase family protein [Burkholderiales bacterium]
MNADGATRALARALFRPRAVALIGASGDPSRNTARPQRFLQQHGYPGRIYPINPRRTEVLGRQAFASVEAVPDPIDHALVMLPAAQVPAALEACARKSIAVVTVFSDGFAEAGPAGARLQAALLDRARALGVRLLGPNSIGLISVCDRLPLTVNAALEASELLAGRTALISQSGSMLGTILSRGQARGFGFSRLVSVGNEADLSVGELVELLVDDAATDTILLFLETIRDAPRLARAARAAWEAGKPVIAFKLGRPSIGEQLAQSHTGAIAGSDAAVSAYFQAHGIARVEMLETLLEIGPLLHRSGAEPTAQRAPQSPSRPRVAVVSTTGGGAAMVADRLGAIGLDVVAPPDSFVAAMARSGVPIRPARIIDLTLTATPQKYATVLSGLLGAEFCDAVLAVVGTSAQFHPELAVRPIVEVAAAGTASRPLAVFLAPQADASLALLARHRIAAFRTPEACADALATALRHLPPASECAPPAPRARRASGRQRAEAPDLTQAPAGVAQQAPAGDAVQSLAPDTPGSPQPDLPGSLALDELEALALFEQLGIPGVERAFVAAPPWSHAIEYPVVAKLVSSKLLHKTEAGAVALNLADPAAYARAVEVMLARAAAIEPRPEIRGVMVQRQAQGLAEVLLGYRADPLVGPVVVLGVGGRLAELYGDVAVRIAPVSHAEAMRMIESVRGLALLRGYRGLPPGDLEALARAVVAMSSLARWPHPRVLEAEVNPLLVGAEGVLAVDGLVVREAPAS